MADDSIDQPLGPAGEQRVTELLRRILERRVVIEQAKGMLMFVYAIDADEAFDILRQQSQDHNVKLHDVAEQVITDLRELAKDKGPARRLAFDGLVVTAHQRITHVADRPLNGPSSAQRQSSRGMTT
jgi:hypothetical protein